MHDFRQQVGRFWSCTARTSFFTTASRCATVPRRRPPPPACQAIHARARRGAHPPLPLKPCVQVISRTRSGRGQGRPAADGPPRPATKTGAIVALPAGAGSAARVLHMRSHQHPGAGHVQGIVEGRSAPLQRRGVDAGLGRLTLALTVSLFCHAVLHTVPVWRPGPAGATVSIVPRQRTGRACLWQRLFVETLRFSTSK